MNQHQPYITAPDDSSQLVREAIPPAAQPMIVIQGSTDEQAGHLPGAKTTALHRGNWYGIPLTWRGLHLLGVAIGIAGVWYVSAWIIHGRPPLAASSIGSPCDDSEAVLPPDWLLVTIGLLVLTSIVMMLVGTQDDARIPKLGKDETCRAFRSTKAKTGRP